MSAQVTQTRDYLERMDADGDGRVSLAEYQAWMRYAFDQMDRNGDGVLTPEEFKAAGISGFEGLGAIRARDLDISGDGYVSREDWTATSPASTVRPS